MFAKTPKPPYYAVIFTSFRTDMDHERYAAMAAKMITLAKDVDGYLGIETVDDGDGYGITVSYWSDEDAIRTWRHDVEHRLAQDLGRTAWYEHYEVRVARVERAYGGPEVNISA